MKKKNKIRLFVDAELSEGRLLSLENGQAHYLLNVMKQQKGDRFLAFDGKNGEYECEIRETAKKNLTAVVLRQTRAFCRCPDIWLLFAPVKKDQTDFIVQKATELGCVAIQPVITARTIAEKTKIERFKAQSIEACEQCRRVDLPEIREAATFDTLLKSWDSSRTLYYMDESGNGRPVTEAFDSKGGKAALLVGPEGGFAEEELARLRQAGFARGVSLGPRILRAETAAAAALACWQALSGDWKEENKQ